jgi:hypothetical protein
MKVCRAEEGGAIIGDLFGCATGFCSFLPSSASKPCLPGKIVRKIFSEFPDNQKYWKISACAFFGFSRRGNTV